MLLKYGKRIYHMPTNTTKARKGKTRGNGEGSIYKITRNNKEVWVAQYPNGRYNNGNIKYIKRKAKTRSEANKKLNQLIIEIGTGKHVKKAYITVKDLALQFIEDGYRLNRLSPNSYNRKKNIWVHLCKHYIANMEIQKVTDNDIKEFLVYITDFSQSVLNKSYGLLNNTLKRAVVKKIIAVNPLDDELELAKPKSKKVTKKIMGFTIEEQKKLLNAIVINYQSLQKNQQIEYKYQFLLALYGGLRMGEVNALDKSLDIDFKNKKLHIRRTLTRDLNDKTIIGEIAKTENGRRTIEMDKQLECILREYIEAYWKPNKENLLFWDHRKNGLFTTTQVNTSFKRLCEKYNVGKGYDVNQHMLRHTFGTRNIEAGMPATVLKKIMGHADIKTTLEIYCDVFDEYERKHVNDTYNFYQDNNLLIELSNNTKPSDTN